jgi:NAD(P)H-dependent FMN reductase
MNIEIVSGSPRSESVTFRVALHLQTAISGKTGCHAGIIDVREWPLSVLQQEVYSSPQRAPASLLPLAERIFNADSFILVSPEYNGSYTPALKLLFDHFPKQSHKAFGIVTASTGVMGGMRASQQMQLLIHALFGIGSPYMLITPQVDKKFDEEGKMIDQSFRKNVDIFLEEFLWLANSLSLKQSAMVFSQ